MNLDTTTTIVLAALIAFIVIALIAALYKFGIDILDFLTDLFK